MALAGATSVHLRRARRPEVDLATEQQAPTTIARYEKALESWFPQDGELYLGQVKINVGRYYDILGQVKIIAGEGGTTSGDGKCPSVPWLVVISTLSDFARLSIILGVS